MRHRDEITAGGIEIRRATLDDLQGMMKIERASFPTPWPVAAIAADICENAFSRTLVAEDGDGVAGFIIYWVVEDERHLQNLAVDPSRRGRGIGRSMVELLVEEARRPPGAVVTLEVRESNDPARALYESFGFEVVGKRFGYYTDTREDAIVMTLDLRR